MAYIGRQLARGENRLFDDISGSFNGSTTTFNLTISSVATSTATPFQLFVSLGGVMQKPNTDFTTAGNQITFTTAPAAGLSCWMMMQGDTIDSAAIPDASVTPSKISGSGDFAFPADVRLKDADGSHYLGFQAPSTVSNNVVWTLPATDTSVSGYVLSSDGSGNLSWVEAGDSSSPSFTGDVTLTNDGSIVGFSSLHGTYTGSVKTYTVTVASKSAAHRYNGTGSGNGYKINGKEAPFLTLTPGRTYKFDQSDGSNSGHPFRFYLEANKTTSYTTGVTTNGTAGSSGAYTQIVVSDTTPQVLHYQCSAHGYMGNSVQTNSNVSSGAVTNLSVSNNATISGNLTVSGTTTTVDSVTLSVKDKNIELGVVSSPSDTTADGGGITLKGASDHTFNWVNSTDAWTSSEHIHLGDNKKFLAGDSSDFQVYHNGSTNIIDGQFHPIELRHQSEVHIKCVDDGAVELYHNNAKKIETTSSGINVTGAINLNGSPLSTAPTITATASGAIAANDPVIVNADGTISKPAVIASALGSEVEFDDEEGDTFELAYEPVNNKIVVAYIRASNVGGHSRQVTCIAGTVNGSNKTITWGNKITLNDGTSSDDHAYRLGIVATNKSGWCVVVWSSAYDNSRVKGASVQTSSSNNNLTKNNQENAHGYGLDLTHTYTSTDTRSLDIAWNTGTGGQEGGIVVQTNTNYDIKAKAVQIDVSNGNLSRPGSPLFVYQAGSNNYQSVAIGFNTDTNEYLVVMGSMALNRVDGRIIYTQSNNTPTATVALTTVSTFGNTNHGKWIHDLVYASKYKRFFVVFSADHGPGEVMGSIVEAGANGALNANGPNISFEATEGHQTQGGNVVYDDDKDLFVTFWRGSNNPTQYYGLFGIVSFDGTTLTKSSSTPETANAGNTQDPACAYDPDTNTVIFAYRDQAQQNDGHSIVMVPEHNTLTEENFIGFAPSAISNSASGTVAVTGNTTTQSSLTAGQKYFVQNNGTLSTTADTPSVEAGIAISSTKLLIKA